MHIVNKMASASESSGDYFNILEEDFDDILEYLDDEEFLTQQELEELDAVSI